MEFSVTLENGQYHFSQVSNSSYLVTGSDLSIIVYKANTWRCADNVPPRLVLKLGSIIESYQKAS